MKYLDQLSKTMSSYASAWKWIDQHFAVEDDLTIDDLADLAMDGFEADLWQSPAHEAAEDWLDGIFEDGRDE